VPADRTPTWLALVPISALGIGLLITTDNSCPSHMYDAWAVCATHPWPPLLIGLGFGSALGMLVHRQVGAVLAVAFAVAWSFGSGWPPLWTILAVGHALSCVAFLYWYRWREARGARTDRTFAEWPRLTRTERLVVALPLAGAAVVLTVCLLPRSQAGEWWDWLIPATLAGALAACYAAAWFTSPRVTEVEMFGDRSPSESTVADLGPPVTEAELAGENRSREHRSYWGYPGLRILAANVVAPPTFLLLSVLHRPGWAVASAYAVALVTLVMVQWPPEWSWTTIRWNAAGFAARNGFATVVVAWREVHGIDPWSGSVQIHTTRGTVSVRARGITTAYRRHSGHVLTALLRREAHRSLSNPDTATVAPPAVPPRRPARWYAIWLAAVVVLVGLLAAVP
jgi:hypothetical protein